MVLQMKEIIFVTSNKGKIASAQKELENIIVLPYNAELIEPRGDDIKEIAKEKVLQAYDLVKRPCIALDSGFFIKALNGFPRAYVNHALDTIGLKGILKLMEDQDDRYCEFRECVAYYDGTSMKFFESKCFGTLSHAIKGTDKINKWSILWHIYIPDGFNKTLAEFNEEDFIKYNRLETSSSLRSFATWYNGI